MDADVLGAHGVHEVNELTVIANESYEDFAKSLQDEFYEVIKNRPKSVTPQLFEGQIWSVVDGKEVEIDSSMAAEIFTGLKWSGLVENGQLSDEYHDMPNELRLEKVGEILEKVDASLTAYSDSAVQLLESVFDVRKQPLVNNGRQKATLNLDHEKYASKQFKELWSRINAKTYYTVNFDEGELIEKCIAALNLNLRVSKTMIVVTEGYLESTKQDTVEMKKLIGKQVPLEEVAARYTTYDLVGDIAKATDLTRKATAAILKQIEPAVFGLFKQNPEEFIREAIKIIDSQKAGTIVERITYNKLNEEWNAEDIFVNPTISGEYGKNIIDTKRHLFDKLRYDSDVERRLAEELDTQDIVELYIKLPSGFHINTPLGTYNPDWAISFREGSVKHIYFVAETKGEEGLSSMSFTSHTGDVAKAKIQCAQQHFARISSDTVKYSAVGSFSELMKVINS